MKSINLVCTALVAGFSCGCSKFGNAAVPAAAPVFQKHEPQPPHGGTAVQLGEDEYRIEFVRDASAGRLQAFVLDDEMENFIRLPAASFNVVARLPGRNEVLTLKAVPNNATGETVGDTALFEVKSDWLKTTPTFDAVIEELTVRGHRYQNIAFNFPKGNDTDEKGK